MRGAQADDYLSLKGLWYDKWSHTLMLKPSQLDPNWLGSIDHAPYVIGLSQMTAPPNALTNKQIWEENYQHNPHNKWIFHSPVGPLAFTPYAAAPGQPDIKAIDQNTNQNTTPSLIGTGNYPEASGLSGDTGRFPQSFAPATDMQWVCWTQDNLPANCPMFLRWHVGPTSAGFATYYIFYIGDVAYLCGPSAVEVLLDSSTGGDWSSTERVASYNLFSSGGGVDGIGAFGQAFTSLAAEYYGHDRSLLVLPFHENWVYLESSFGKAAVFPTRGRPTPNMDKSDWDITDGNRKMYIGALTAGLGWFQISKVKFFDGPATIRISPFTIDYTPAAALTIGANVVLKDDTPPNSTCIATNLSTPPIYAFGTNPINGDCLPLTTTTDGSNLTRQYGMNITLSPGWDSADATKKIYTPQLYGYDITIPKTTVTWPNTSLTIQSVTPATSLSVPYAVVQKAMINVQINRPGSFTAEVMDRGQSLAALYNRADYPIIFEDRNTILGVDHPIRLWTGIVEPSANHPARLDTVAPDTFAVQVSDFFKWLGDTAMRDTTDFTGQGHIHVMQFVAQLAGLDITGWDGPGDTPGPPQWGPPNNPLGGLNVGVVPNVFQPQISSIAQPLKPAWRPNFNPPDSYATYMHRIAEYFSGWDFGFHADGSVYYHPYDYYSTSEQHFNAYASEGRPYYMPPVEYKNIECDANIIQGAAGQPNTNTLLYTHPIKDWGSLLNPAAPNYLGRPKFVLFSMPGALSCDELYKCAYAVFNRARRARRTIQFKATFMPGLRVGHCCDLEGIAGVWRVQGYRAELIRNGWALATYECELVAKGYV